MRVADIKKSHYPVLSELQNDYKQLPKSVVFDLNKFERINHFSRVLKAVQMILLYEDISLYEQIKAWRDLCREVSLARECYVEPSWYNRVSCHYIQLLDAWHQDLQVPVRSQSTLEGIQSLSLLVLTLRIEYGLLTTSKSVCLATKDVRRSCIDKFFRSVHTKNDSESATTVANIQCAL